MPAPRRAQPFEQPHGNFYLGFIRRESCRSPMERRESIKNAFE
jgi:hypothetical protein